MLKITLTYLAILLTTPSLVYSHTSLQDALIPGYSLKSSDEASIDKPYTILKYSDYQATVYKAKYDVEKMLSQINAHKNSDTYLNNIVETAGNYLENIPYGGNEGEGNGCDPHINKGKCIHIQQDPLYRTDSLNCTTLVQLILGLINANNLKEYTQNILKIEYGAETNYGHPTEELITYTNRNNFADGDFNPVNQKSGLLTDITDRGIFCRYSNSINAITDRANWFAFQARPERISNNVRVFNAKRGRLMAEKFSNNYGGFYHPETVSTKYIPKFSLVNAHLNGSLIKYTPNEYLINQIPTPSVVEVIRDDSKWFINGTNIVDLIGSGTSVSHMALLYRHHFNEGDIIYQKTYCYLNEQQQNKCKATPMICDKKDGCTKIIMLAATSAYPEGFVWSVNQKTKKYSCTDPKAVLSGYSIISNCNRVNKMPFGNYIVFQYNGTYRYLSDPSIVGFNIEKINLKK